MHNDTSIFSSLFEADLLTELETKSMLMQVNRGEIMLNPGQTIRAVPLVISGLFKVSRVNDEGQEMLLYLCKGRRELCHDIHLLHDGTCQRNKRIC